MNPKPEHQSPLVPQEGDLPVEPDEGQVPPTGIPADPEFERVKKPED